MRVAAESRSAVRRTVAVDGVLCFEVLLERGQRRLRPWIEHTVSAAGSSGVEHREDDRDVRVLPRLGGCRVGARAVEAIILVPEGIEAGQRLLGCDLTRLGGSGLSALLQPRGATRERFRLHELRVIVVTAVLFPDIAAGLTHVGERKSEIGAHDIAEC